MSAQGVPELLKKVLSGEVQLSALLGLSGRVLEQMTEGALAMAKAGQPQKACDLLEQICRVETSWAMPPMLLGSIYAEMGNHLEAVKNYQSAQNRASPSHDRFQQELGLMAAQSYLQLDDRPQAEAALQLALQGPLTSVISQAIALQAALDHRREAQK